MEKTRITVYSGKRGMEVALEKRHELDCNRGNEATVFSQERERVIAEVSSFRNYRAS